MSHCICCTMALPSRLPSTVTAHAFAISNFSPNSTSTVPRLPAWSLKPSPRRVAKPQGAKAAVKAALVDARAVVLVAAASAAAIVVAAALAVVVVATAAIAGVVVSAAAVALATVSKAVVARGVLKAVRTTVLLVVVMNALASVRQRRALVNAAKGVLTPIAASKKRASQAALTAQTAKAVLINLPENSTTNAQPRRVLGAMHLLASALCAQPNPKAISVAAALAMGERLRARGFSPNIRHRDLALRPDDSLELGQSRIEGPEKR